LERLFQGLPDYPLGSRAGHVRQRCAEPGFAGSKARRPWQFVWLVYRDRRINIFGFLVSVNRLAGRVDARGRQKVR